MYGFSGKTAEIFRRNTLTETNLLIFHRRKYRLPWLLLFFQASGMGLLLICQSQQIVNTCSVKSGKFNQNTWWYTRPAIFIIAVGSLTASQVSCKLPLLQIIVFPKISYVPVHIVLHPCYRITQKCKTYMVSAEIPVKILFPMAAADNGRTYGSTWG